MWKAVSLEKTMILGKTEGRRRRAWQNMKWLDGITNSMDMSLIKVWERWSTGKPGILQSMGVTKSKTQLSNWTTTTATSGSQHGPSHPWQGHVEEIWSKAWRCWSWNSNTLATWCEELTHWKRPWCWERLKVGGEGNDRRWDGWMESPTQWTWVWASCGSWWMMESQSRTWVSDWTELILIL